MWVYNLFHIWGPKPISSILNTKEHVNLVARVTNISRRSTGHGTRHTYQLQEVYQPHAGPDTSLQDMYVTMMCHRSVALQSRRHSPRPFCRVRCLLLLCRRVFYLTHILVCVSLLVCVIVNLVVLVLCCSVFDVLFICPDCSVCCRLFLFIFVIILLVLCRFILPFPVIAWVLCGG